MKRFFFPLMVLLTACGTCAPLPEESSVPAGPKPEPISRVELSDGEKARVESGNVFAFKLLEQVFGSTKKSVFISPLSVQYALGMVNNGASGATEKEISTVLGQEGRDGINEVCAHLLRDLPRVDTSVVLSLANGIVLNDAYTLKPAFKEAVERYYDARVEKMSYADPNAVIARVNGWCAEKTRGMIREIIQDVHPDAILFALNAIYFKGSWTEAFEAKMTRKAPFTTLSGAKTEVDMMHQQGEFRYAETAHFQRLTLPYGNGKYAMEVFLPKEEIPSFLSYLAATPWKEVPGGYNGEVIVSFPRFETETFLTLNTILSALGMPRAFTNAAEFFDLVEEADAKISRVLHKARIEVEEKGTEAAAVTAVEMVKVTAIPNPPKPKVFTADRPFVYVITERTSGAVLFTGVYTGE